MILDGSRSKCNRHFSFAYSCLQPIYHSADCTLTSTLQAFVALANGEIKTYDLLCLRISQYMIPNAWKAYEEKSLLGGSESASPTS